MILDPERSPPDSASESEMFLSLSVDYTNFGAA